ncbi:MAG: hypothetical protein D4R45_05675 [Planctomycetaceae bacterium]|nr:MAG: hypothetical protein D4R45_05675 [Planctomycetaceae bacterium]
MKFKGEVKLKKVTPQRMRYVGEIEGLSLPLNIDIPGAIGLQRTGTITIEILKVGERPAKAEDKPPAGEKPKGKGKK